MKLICLDGGTTNTRLRLMNGNSMTDSVRCSVGSSSHDNAELKKAVAEMVKELLGRNGLCENDIPFIIVSGMATSEFGLYEIAHITLPADISDFAKHCEKISLPDVSSIPFLIIPGAKNSGDEPDMMRGEETECFGICGKLSIVNSAAVILPGTHNKIILFDGKCITECFSMMSGEIISLLSDRSLLRHSLPHPLPKNFIEEALIKGADYCANFGLTDAAFKVRSMAKSGKRTGEWLASYLVGAVLYCDILSVKGHAEGFPLYIGGSEPLKSEMVLLCKRYTDNTVIKIDEDLSQLATAYGQIGLYDIWQKRKNQ